MRTALVLIMIGTASQVHAAPPKHFESPLVQVGAAGDLTMLAMDQGAYEAMRTIEHARITDFVLGPGHEVALDVEQFDVVNGATQILVGDQAMDRPDQVLLRGTVVGWPESRVFLSLSPLGTNGLIDVDGQSFVIADARRSEHETVVYNMMTIDPATMPMIEFICGTDHLPVADLAAAHLMPTGKSPCRIAQIAVDTDWEFTNSLFGDDTEASAAYALTLMAAQSEIYSANFNTRFHITFLRVWAENNDPYGSLDGFVELETFVNHWQTFMGDVDRHAAHLLSGKQFFNLGGVAYLPGLCTDFGYGLSGYLNGFFPYPLEDHSPLNWDPFVVGHELGHNFGAPHTHQQNPPVDNCGNGDCTLAFGGTIMSYCHGCPGGMTNIVLGFADQTINNHVLPYLDSVNCPLIASPVVIDEHPDDLDLCEGQTAKLNAAASGTEPITYQWFKDGESIDGATEPTLVIEDVSFTDEGEYLVVASNGCSEAASDSAMVYVAVGCAGDLNGDCVLSILDFVELQILFQAGDDAADINGDGELSVLDFIAYQQLFNQGC